MSPRRAWTGETAKIARDNGALYRRGRATLVSDRPGDGPCNKGLLKMRLPLGLSLAAAILLAGAPAAFAASAGPAEHRDAREQTPAALLGLWKADLAASTYPGNKPRSALRSFQYTADGKVLVTFMTLGANGAYSTGHWAAQVDGTPGIEYHSAAGSIPYNTVTLTKVSDTVLNLGVFRNGVRTMTAVYTLSADGQTLTYAYDQTRIVYRKWNLAD
jgi:hypothetical protein